MAGRGDVPQVPRGSLVGRSELARVPRRLLPGADSTETSAPRVERQRHAPTAPREARARPAPKAAPAQGRKPEPKPKAEPAKADAKPDRSPTPAKAEPAPRPTSAKPEAAKPSRREAAAADGDEVAGAARRGRCRRQEHERLAGRADRHQRARHPGQADDRQPRRHQQPPQAHPRRQDLLHPPAGLRDRAGGQEVPEHEPALRRGRRQAERRHARAHQPGPGHRPAGQGRQPPARRRRHQALRDNAFRPVHRRLRGHRAPRPRRQADRRGLRGRHDLADQPRHHRHRALRAAADARPGRDRRRRRDGVPGRVPGRQRGADRRDGPRQADHAHLDLRPPHHPGRRVRRLPAHHPPAAALRRLLRRDLPRARHPVRAGAVAHRQPGLDLRQERPRSSN